ncbi:hypothetical protein V0M98_32860 (plasmid) [Pseudomonas silesiensis]|uniref:hypothetical protein n=1 Tax=Pseudomonas silesiensis TaxID=1853130 RepID=UPI0030D202C6
MNTELTPRLLSLMDSSFKCGQLALVALGKGVIDSDDFKTIIARLGVIESRSMLLLACLNVEEIEADLTQISLPDEIEFMDGADLFIREIQAIIAEASVS